jgi:hypothetical protein
MKKIINFELLNWRILINLKSKRVFIESAKSSILHRKVLKALKNYKSHCEKRNFYFGFADIAVIVDTLKNKAK